MKKILALTMLISFTLICSCHKQASTAEQQLAERKEELTKLNRQTAKAEQQAAEGALEEAAQTQQEQAE